MCSRPAEGLLDALMRLRGTGVGCKGGLVLIGIGENRQEFLERGKVLSLHSSRDDRLDAMVARDEGRVDGAHGRLPHCTLLWLPPNSIPPAHGPPVKSSGVDE